MPRLPDTAAILALICLTCTAALGFEPMTAAIRVSSASLYDYVLIGEHPKATHGYDNAYDTVTPGNLNAAMGEPFISVVATHPEWKPALRELRGDVRPPSRREEWQISIASSLARGTPLAVTLQAERSRLPQGMKLTLREGNKEYDLRTGTRSLSAPGPGALTKVTLIAEQP